jgi:hypothetical protein
MWKDMAVLGQSIIEHSHVIAAGDVSTWRARAKEALIAPQAGPFITMGVEVERRHAHPGNSDVARAQIGIRRLVEEVVATGGG